MGAGCSTDASVQTGSTPSQQPKADAPLLMDQKQLTAEATNGDGDAPTSAPKEPSPSAGAESTIAPDAANRKLTILHFNDIYNIEEQERDPKGGASRLCCKVKEYRAAGTNPLVFFSGDAYNPSLMSTITMGKQMVPILNEIGVTVSCMGNHDFDYGLENLLKLNAQCNFPWLMANVFERGTDKPYANAGATWVQDWNGVKVGVVGLVEEEWLETLGAVPMEEMEYRDFIAVGRQAAQELKAAGAELLIALTHMREPNDRKLAAEVPEFHLVLGGHDHHYVADYIQPHGNLLVKSGTDFRDLSVVEVEVPAAAAAGAPAVAPKLTVQRIPIDSTVPEDPVTKALVEEYTQLMGEKMGETVGETLEPLDGLFQTVRNRESNLGNFVVDVWRKAARADIAILNSGSLRSDQVHPVGALTAKDFVSILPMVAPTVVLQCTGAQVIAALENGVSQWPKLEGRFPQVSGVRFRFDPSREPGQRILAGSVMVCDGEAAPQPIGLERKYRVATPEYLASGKDGFRVFTECKTLVDGESGVVIPTALKCHFIQLSVLNKWEGGGSKGALQPLTAKWLRKAQESKTPQQLDALESEGDSGAPAGRSKSSTLQERSGGLAVRHPEAGHYVISPVVEGRIVNIAEEKQEEAEAKAEGQAEEV